MTGIISAVVSLLTALLPLITGNSQAIGNIIATLIQIIPAVEQAAENLIPPSRISSLRSLPILQRPQINWRRCRHWMRSVIRRLKAPLSMRRWTIRHRLGANMDHHSPLNIFGNIFLGAALATNHWWVSVLENINWILGAASVPLGLILVVLNIWLTIRNLRRP